MLFSWNQRPREPISFENLRLATQLSEAELRKTLWVSVQYPTFLKHVQELKAVDWFADPSVSISPFQLAHIDCMQPVQTRSLCSLPVYV